MKIEIHLLQNFAPSCLNRDDTNTPKSCVFGDRPRARVSSQCWKRAVRRLFADENAELVGTRTKRLVTLLRERLGPEIKDESIKEFVGECYSKMDGKRGTETAVLVFIGEAEVAAAAECIAQGVTPKEASPRLRSARQSVDIALFGRMLAEKPEGSIDAACQVAHAISTHAVDMEDDFYTAVDDLVEARGEIGAGMMGTQGFNSACFYRYAVVDINQLAANLGGDRDTAKAAVQAFLRAFSLAVPSAKQNSHAAQSLPSFGLLVARDHGGPISLANAFAKPIRGDDLIGSSIRALTNYQARVQEVYGLYDGATLAAFHDRDDAAPLGLPAGVTAKGLSAAIAAIMERMA